MRGQTTLTERQFTTFAQVYFFTNQPDIIEIVSEQRDRELAYSYG
ncbi:MAG: hypothetical protein PUP92_12990 [Rhizonema sp. PD38]|nr:hypothetical protein [Rhizonema sp. PD38]